jgi:hypothetical protein
MSWHSIGTESPQETALQLCSGFLDIGDGYGHGLGYGYSTGDGWGQGNGYGYSTGDGSGGGDNNPGHGDCYNPIPEYSKGCPVGKGDGTGDGPRPN